MKMALKYDEKPYGALHECALRFIPFVRKLAWRYRGRGAEVEDLISEGYIQLCDLLKLYVNTESDQDLPLFLSRRLPSRVRDAASGLRNEALSLENAYLEYGYEPVYHEDGFSEIECLTDLARSVRKEDVGILRHLMNGSNCSDIARKRGISRQAVSKRIRRIREKLALKKC